MKKYRNRLLAIAAVILALACGIGAVTHGHWRRQVLSASVTINGRPAQNAAVYQMPSGDWVVAPHENGLWGRSTAYLIPKSGDDVRVCNVVLQNWAYDGGFDFLVFPFAIYQRSDQLLTAKLGGSKDPTKAELARYHDGFEWTSDSRARVRVRL